MDGGEGHGSVYDRKREVLRRRGMKRTDYLSMSRKLRVDFTGRAVLGRGHGPDLKDESLIDHLTYVLVVLWGTTRVEGV